MYQLISDFPESVEPYAVRAVRSGDQVLYTRPSTTLQPSGSPTARAAIRDFLATVVREGTGKAARVTIPSAGKTGTTQQNKDAWFVGYTPDIVVGIWVGNDDSSPTRNVTGGDLPARMWNEFVTQSMAARTKIARAQLQTLVPAGSEGTNAKATPSAAAVRGQPVVKNTGTLDFQGRVIRLFGVAGTRGRPTRDFRRYLGPREVVCEPADSSNEYRCRVDDQDLSRVVLFNGGGRAKANAPAEFRTLEQQARSSRVGIWGGDDDDDD
jgi:penicillin-binding protein 1A